MKDFQTVDVDINDLLNNLKDGAMVEVYTDGSCLGNPGPGGWAAIIIFQNMRATLSGATNNATTNNRMELMAAIEALKSLPSYINISIYTDSNYLREGILVWMEDWKQNGWISSLNKPVKNQDLWRELDKLAMSHNVSWNWVKGHADCTNNNNADFIARSAISKMLETK